MHTFLDQRHALTDLADHFPRRALDCGDHLLDFAGRQRRAFGEFAHLVGNDGEAASLFAGPRRLDGRVECQQIGLISDVLDHADDIGDFLRLVFEAGNLLGGMTHHVGHFADAGNQAFDLLIAGLCLVIRPLGEIGGFAGVGRNMVDRHGDFLDIAGDGCCCRTLDIGRFLHLAYRGSQFGGTIKNRSGAVPGFQQGVAQAVLHFVHRHDQQADFVLAGAWRGAGQITVGDALRGLDAAGQAATNTACDEKGRQQGEHDANAQCTQAADSRLADLFCRINGGGIGAFGVEFLQRIGLVTHLIGRLDPGCPANLLHFFILAGLGQCHDLLHRRAVGCNGLDELIVDPFFLAAGDHRLIFFQRFAEQFVEAIE